jgi:hypothetical protein
LIKKSTRSLYFPDGKFDWKMLILTIAVLAAQVSIMVLISINFSLARKAGLNIGITLTVHALQTFFVAFADFLMFGSVLETSQLIGVVTILGCVALVSLEKHKQDVTVKDSAIPVYLPMLFSFAVPILGAVYSILIKMVSKKADVL